MRALTHHNNSARASTPCRAALTGGARKRGRGCLFSLAFGAGLAGLASADDALAVPSGQAVSFLDMVQDHSAYGLTYHFRFLAPQIAAGLGFEEAATDMEALCNGFALPRLSTIGPKPAQVVIALLSEPVEFGESAPDITQYFEAYSIQDGLCMWEAL